MIQRKKIRKFESSVALSRPKDNSTYMSIFPLQKSNIYLSDGDNKEHEAIQFKDEQLVDHFRSLIKQQHVGKHQVDKYFASVLTRPTPNAKAPVSTTFLDQYNLETQDLVEVCQKKVFTLKSYYNYLHDEEIQKAMTKIQERNHNLQSQLLKERQKLMAEEEAQKYQHPSKIGRARQEEVVLDPAHVRFEDNIVSFNPKQKERLDISRWSNYRQVNRWS